MVLKKLRWPAGIGRGGDWGCIGGGGGGRGVARFIERGTVNCVCVDDGLEMTIEGLRG